MSSFANEVFLESKNNLRTAVVTSVILVLVFLGFHLLSFSSYVHVKADLSAIDQQLAEQSIAVETLEQSVTSLKKASKVAERKLQALSKQLIKDLIAQMKGLDQAIEDIRYHSPAHQEVLEQLQTQMEQEVEIGQVQRPIDFAQMEQVPNMAQVAQSIPRLDSAHVISDPKLLQLLDDDDIGGLQQYLPDYERQQIIKPFFAQANQQWQRQIKPQYLAQLNQSLDTLQQLAARSGEIKPELVQIGKDINAQKQWLEQFNLTPPDGRRWWKTVQGKGASIRSVEARIASKMDSVSSLSKGKDKMAAVIKATQVSKAALVKQKAHLEESFKGQQTQLQSLGSGFAVLAVDLESLSLSFPAILGLLVGLSLHWIAHASRNLLASVEMLLAEKSQQLALPIWLAQVSLSVSKSSLRHQVCSGESIGILRGRVFLKLQAVVLAVVFGGWICIASYQSTLVQPWSEIMVSFIIAIVLLVSGIVSLTRARIALLNLLPATVTKTS